MHTGVAIVTICSYNTETYEYNYKSCKQKIKLGCEMMNKNLSTVRELAEYSVEKFNDKDFCRFYVKKELHVKSFKEFYEDSLAVCRYIKNKEKERIHIAFIGRTSYEYIACLTGMIFSGNVVVPFAPDITVGEILNKIALTDAERNGKPQCVQSKNLLKSLKTTWKLTKSRVKTILSLISA